MAVYIDRPPRIQPELPQQEIPIPAAPDDGAAQPLDIVSLLLPMISMVGFAVFSATGNLAGAIPMGFMLVSSVGLAVYQQWKARKEAGVKLKQYLETLKQLRRDMSQSHNTQRIFFNHNYPDIPTLLNIAAYKEQSQETSRFGTRLWERRSSDADFGVVRLGIGSRASTVVYKAQDNAGAGPARDALRLDHDSRVLTDAPVTIQIRNRPTDLSGNADEKTQRERAIHGAPQHAIGIIGKNKTSIGNFARAITAHFAAFQAPIDAQIWVIGNPERKSEWKFAEWLPHCTVRNVGDEDETSEDKQFDQLCFSNEQDDVNQFFRLIRKDLEQRQLRLSESNEDTGAGGGGNVDVSLPMVLVFVDLLGAMPETSPLKDIAGDATIAKIIGSGPQLGASVIFLAEDASRIPSGCGAMIEVGSVGDRIVFRYAETGVNGARLLGDADQLEARQAEELFAKKIRHLDLQRPFGSDLPRAVTFLQMQSVLEKTRIDSVDKLPIERNWTRSIEPARQEWLSSPVGMISMRDVRSLVFSAKEGGDGVHGMVAGTTGSGKSEMLMTMIAGMALRYDPRIVNFVLVDYKGGQAFESFRNLPHTVDILTNLSPNAVERMFIAIQAVMDQRAALLAESGVSDLVKYRAEVAPKLAPDDPRPRTFPHLFIIVDEFAEMIQANPDYRAKFESITRLGRAFGVSLVLATQRPAGAVSDQMRANMKFKICLRVETTDDSKELLGSPEAAFLPNLGGRGYIKSGNELMQAAQIAWAGEKYTGTPKVTLKDVYWLDEEKLPDPKALGKVLYTPGEIAQALRLEEPPRVLLDWIVGAMAVQANRLGVPPQSKPWPNPLPEQLSMTSPVDARYLNTERDLTPEKTIVINEAVEAWLNRFEDTSLWPDFNWRAPVPLRVDIGLIDNPYRAENRMLTMDISAGPTVIFGAAGRGKTTFLKSLLVALGASRTPNELHLYALDFGRGGLKSIAALPHLGASIDASQPARVEQLLRMLRNFINERQEELSRSPYGTLAEYNANTPANVYPDIICVIDNFAEFKESYEHLIPDVLALTRDGRQFGVHFVVTATAPGDLSAKLYNQFVTRMTLTQTDAQTYSDIVGGGARPFDNVPGRGLIGVSIKEGEKPTPLEFQIGLPGVYETPQPGMEDAEVAAIEARNAELLNQNFVTTCARMEQIAKALGYKRPAAELPRSLTLFDMWSRIDKREVRSLSELRIADKWTLSMQADQQEWLRGPVGLISDKDVRALHFQAQADGVHGMAAGTTGSGKSELLQTLISSMAIKYDPRIVNFVLIDYKGGPTVEPFKKLPHAVDIATNLDGNAVERIFIAVEAEMNRRSAILARAGVADLVDYRKKIIPTLKADSPFPRTFPHLFIIVDEFAEMVTQNPDYKKKFESITRLGRSFGVSLILATQRPSGAVTDQMRANMKFRISLRVETPADSKELLGRDDGARLPAIAGRGYIQAGSDMLTEVQAAWSGAPYQGDPPGGTYKDAEILSALDTEERPRSMLGWVVGALAAEQIRAGIPKQTKPWPDPMPALLPINLPIDATYMPEPGASRDAISARRVRDMVLSPALARWIDNTDARPLWSAWDWKDKLPVTATFGVIDNPFAAEQTPLSINVADPIIVFGASGRGKTTFVKSLLFALAAERSPVELNIYALDFGRGALKAVGALPHCGATIDSARVDRVEALFRMMRGILAERQEQLAKFASIEDYNAHHKDNPDAIFPSIVFVIDNFAEFKENFEYLMPDFMSMVRDGRQFGVHFIVTANNTGDIGNKLLNLFGQRVCFTMTESGAYHDLIGRPPLPLPDMPGRGFIPVMMDNKSVPLEFHVATPVIEGEKDPFMRIAATMEKARIAAGMKRPSAEIPKAVTFLEMQQAMLLRKIDRIGDLDIAGNWKRSMQPENSDWLRAALGLVSSKEVRSLYFTAKAGGDGVHGLAAGTTGSGKSELIQTLIASMAVNYDPRIVNFVLIDYKGGPTVEPFRQLPHAVDIATNLDGNAVDRIFIAINAEMNRRSAILAKAGVADLVEYRKKVIPTLRPDSPLPRTFPHLFIIVDEFAEMISQTPEYKQKFESITRLGRSFGVSLILAAQKPSGVVTDQMKANMKFRVCLRVETADDSKELLGRPDAATLPSIGGRGYVQTGGGPLIELQAAWSGAPYDETRPDPAYPVDAVLKAMGKEDDPPRSLLGWLVGAMALEAKRQAIPKQFKPWPDLLPAVLPMHKPFDASYIAELRDRGEKTVIINPDVAAWIDNEAAEPLWTRYDYKTRMPIKAAVGIVDNTYEAQQSVLQLDITGDPLLIMGASGRGKTGLVRSFVLALAAKYSPLDLQMFALDFGRGGLKALRNLPHMGGVVDGADDERVERTFRIMRNIIDERQRALATYEDIDEYNAKHPDRPMASVLLIIDNAAEFRETYDKYLGDLVQLLRDGRPFGVYFVLTGTLMNDVPGKVFNLVAQKVTFYQSDPTDYFNILGRRGGIIPDVPGRGLLLGDVGGTPYPLEFHVAAPFDDDGSDMTRALVARMKTAWERVLAETPALRSQLPKPVEPLALNIDLADCPPPAGAGRLPLRVSVGIDDNNREAAVLDFEKASHLLVVGPPMAGKTTALRAIALSIAQNYPPDKVGMVLIDPSDTARRFFNYGASNGATLADLPHVLQTVTSARELDDLIMRLRCEYDENTQALLKDRTDVFYPVNPNERAIVILFDHYEEAESIHKGSRRGGIEALTELIKGKHLHVIVGGSLDIMRSGGVPDLRKKVESSRHALVLQDVDTVRFMGIRGQFTSKEMPAGRGYLVRGLSACLMQTAMPVVDGKDGRSADDMLAERLAAVIAREPIKARWSYYAEDFTVIDGLLGVKPAATAPAASNGLASGGGAPVDLSAFIPATDAQLESTDDMMAELAGLLAKTKPMEEPEIKLSTITYTMTDEEAAAKAEEDARLDAAIQALQAANNGNNGADGAS